jgi:hypothetical protein
MVNYARHIKKNSGACGDPGINPNLINYDTITGQMYSLI